MLIDMGKWEAFVQESNFGAFHSYVIDVNFVFMTALLNNMQTQM